MGDTQVAFEEKIMEMCPDMSGHGTAVSLRFSARENAWIARLRKDGHELITHRQK